MIDFNLKKQAKTLLKFPKKESLRPVEYLDVGAILRLLLNPDFIINNRVLTELCERSEIKKNVHIEFYTILLDII